MKLFWISWYQPTEDYRPLRFPPNKAVLEWWRTGERYSDDASTICALVSAEDEEAAKQEIQKDWPEAVEWRFVEPKDDVNY